MKYRMSAVAVTLAFAALACSSGRDVEVSGEISAPATAQVQASLVVEFLDVTGEGDAIETSVAHTIALDAPGVFKETVSLAGDKVIVRAIVDADGDGACSVGELWGESPATEIGEEGRVEALALVLGSAACPAE